MNNKIGTISWHIVDNKYIEYLKRFDLNVQNIDYKDAFKPYIGIVLNVNNFDYYVPVSSVKNKHYKMAENMDFVKIMQNNRILCVINLNNMVPILDNQIKLLKFADLSNYQKFENDIQKYKYISLLNKEIKEINNKKYDINNRAKQLYELKYEQPYSRIAKRCCDYHLLEEKCVEYSRVQAVLPELEYIKDENDLYYIYDNLYNKEEFEDKIKKYDVPEKSNEIQKLNIEDINSFRSRSVDIEIEGVAEIEIDSDEINI